MNSDSCPFARDRLLVGPNESLLLLRGAAQVDSGASTGDEDDEDGLEVGAENTLDLIRALREGPELEDAATKKDQEDAITFAD